MKRLLLAISLMLALNFLALGGAVGWLWQSGHLDRPRIDAIKAIVFPATQPTTQPTTQPDESAAPSATSRLQKLLAQHTGRSAVEQIDVIQQSFDATLAELDRREREVADREEQVARANARLAEDRKTLETDRQAIVDQQRLTERLAGDKGFQDTLNLYNSMPARQVKSIFMTMDESTAADYLDSMSPRTAAKVLKEFKTPDEVDRMKRMLEKMRHPPTPLAPATQQAKG